jgi:Zn-dependent protease
VLVAAAGPASNLVLAFVASLVLAVLPVSPQTLDTANLSAPIATILSRTMVLNVLLAVFNRIPIPPLDGGNVLAGLLPYRLAAEFNRVRPYGFLLLYVLIFTGGFETLVLPPYRLILSWLPAQ